MKNSTRILLAACLLAGFGCSKQTTRTTKTADGSEVTMSGDADKATMEVKTASGEKAHLEGSATGMALPADFPKDIPVFPKSVLKLSSGGGAMHLYAFVVPASQADGMAFYEKEFQAQGWDSKPHMAMGNAMMLQGKKGARTFILTLGTEGGETKAQLTLTGS